MVKRIRKQSAGFLVFYILFAMVGLILLVYYLSNTLFHFTTPQQFPINSFHRFPLTYLIFPAELFSFFFSLYFVYNLITGNAEKPDPKPLPGRKDSRVAILIPVYNEPKDIVARTLAACRSLRWDGGVSVYLLDDSTSEKDKANMDLLSEEYGAILIRRKDRVGYKAGNINHAISAHVTEPFFAILDSDQAPVPEFLEETMDHFSDPEVGFVQTPQYFINNDSPIERAQQLGSNIFYQAQCKSKADDLAMPFCGTNLVVRTAAFRLVKGFRYFTATEDIEVGMRMNEAGYHGAFVPKVLVHGYAVTDFNAYASQQYRWANGNLAILRKNWLRLLFGRFSLRQQVHFSFTIGWWLIGFVSLLYIAVPILSIFFGGTHHTWLPTMILSLLFLNVAMGISMIYAALSGRIDDDKVTVEDAFLQYSLVTNSMFIYAKAAFNAALGRYVGFVRTDKGGQKAGLSAIRWNLILAVVCFGFSIFTLFKAVTAGSIEQVRAYLPISLWLVFYTIILASSILFVGKPTQRPVSLMPAYRRSGRAQ